MADCVHGLMSKHAANSSPSFLCPCASMQMRIHRTHNTELYLRTRSRPIVEHCTGLGFAPYPSALLASPQLQPLLSQHRLAEETSTWEQVRSREPPTASVGGIGHKGSGMLGRSNLMCLGLWKLAEVDQGDARFKEVTGHGASLEPLLRGWEVRLVPNAALVLAAKEWLAPMHMFTA